jgi:hypothetical protein
VVKGKSGLIIAVSLVLVGGLAFAQIGGNFTVSQKPAATVTQNLPPAPSAIVQEPKATPLPERSFASGKLEMAPESKTLYSSSAPGEGDYSYTLRREKKEVVITSGVSYVPGEGLNIKTAKPDEVVQIQRDNSYNTDYQVMLKKKY